MPIKRQPQALPLGVTQGKESGFSAARNAPIGRDVLDGTLKRGHRNFRILCADFLVRRVRHAMTGESLPIANPVHAELAITVINQKRLAGRVCRQHDSDYASRIKEHRGEKSIVLANLSNGCLCVIPLKSRVQIAYKWID